MCVVVFIKFTLIGLNSFNQFFKREESKEVKCEPALQVIDTDLAVVRYRSLSDRIVILSNKIDNHVNAKEYIQRLIQELLRSSQILPKGNLVWHVSDRIQDSSNHQNIPKHNGVGILT